MVRAANAIMKENEGGVIKAWSVTARMMQQHGGE